MYGGDDRVMAADSSTGYRDYLYGHEGNDSLIGQRGRDYVQGNSDADSLYGGKGDDEIHGAYGTDQIAGGDGSDLMYGGRDTDIHRGGTSPDTIEDYAGEDVIDHDQVCGGKGVDSINVRENDSGSTDDIINPNGTDSVIKDSVDNEVTSMYCSGEPTGAGEAEDVDETAFDLLDQGVLQ